MRGTESFKEGLHPSSSHGVGRHGSPNPKLWRLKLCSTLFHAATAPATSMTRHTCQYQSMAAHSSNQLICIRMSLQLLVARAAATQDRHADRHKNLEGVDVSI